MSIRKSQNVSLPIKIFGQIVEQVNRFQQLCCWNDNKLDPDIEIKADEQARNGFMRLKKSPIHTLK